MFILSNLTTYVKDKIMPIKLLQLMCVVPGDIYIDPDMDVWRLKVCDVSFDNLECYVCEGDLESLNLWFEKESNSNVIVHHECTERLVPGELFPVFNTYREIYKAEKEIDNPDRDSDDSREAAEDRYLDLLTAKVKELKINAKSNEE